MEEGPIQEGKTCIAVAGVNTSSPTFKTSNQPLEGDL